MTRVTVIDRITSSLAQLASYFKLNSGQNLNTAAGLAEDFCVPLLEFVYGYKLVSVNVESKNAAAIDLLDRRRRLAVQVTVNDTPGKIRDTHRAVPGSQFAAEFDRVIIFFLVRKAPKPPRNLAPCSSHSVSILDFDGIVSAIRGLGLSRQEEIARFLENEIGNPAGAATENSVSNELALALLNQNIFLLTELRRRLGGDQQLSPPPAP